MGGGEQPQAPPPPAPGPSPLETSAQAIQAQIDAQPKILAAQQQYGPQFSQLNLEQLQQYGPEYAQAALDLQRQFGPQFADVERSLSPELVGAQNTLSSFLSGSDNQNQFRNDVTSGTGTILNQLSSMQNNQQTPQINYNNQQTPSYLQNSVDYSSMFSNPLSGGQPSYLQPGAAPGMGTSTINQYLSGNDEQEFNALRPGLVQDVRAAQSQRGIGAISPLGSIDEAVQVQQLKESLKNRRLGIAQGAAGIESGAQSQLRGLSASRESQSAGIESSQQSQAAGFTAGNESQIRSLLAGVQSQYTGIQAQRESELRAQQAQSQALQSQNLFAALGQASNMAQLQQSLNDRRINVALSTAGRVPIGGVPQMQGQTGTGQLVQSVDPNSIFGYQQGLNNFNASIFNTQSGVYGQQLSNQGNPFGSILGGVAGGLTGGLSTGLGYGMMGFCWVAAEVFNEPMDGPTVSNARRFILTEMPDWFKLAYIKYGERVARFISNKPILKNLIRPFFSWMAKKGAI